jgi:cytochrome c oxidase subunit IV
MAEATAHGSGHSDTAHDHGHDTTAAVHAEVHQEHPIRLYLIVWGWLFILSACSYFVDYVGFQGYLRWSLILIFMVLKAGLIVAVFMHMAFERPALSWAILLPPVAVLVFVALMVFEADYTALTRMNFFGLGG